MGCIQENKDRNSAATLRPSGKAALMGCIQENKDRNFISLPALWLRQKGEENVKSDLLYRPGGFRLAMFSDLSAGSRLLRVCNLKGIGLPSRTEGSFFGLDAIVNQEGH
jgi:hypothetical protein